MHRDKSKTGMRIPRRKRERGYVMLSLLLGASLLAIAAAAAAPKIAMQIRRDQEEEMIHRAAQYRRAVRRFTKQTGRYPMTVEDLQSTNGIRFLRKQYKDPLTGKPFHVLRMSEMPAAAGVSANAWSLQAAPSTSNPDNSMSEAPSDAQANGTATTLAPPATGTPSASPSTRSFPSPNTDNNSFGGGAIIGVVSTSKGKTIREFNRKSRYNEWYFFYDPTFERAYEVPGPTPLMRPPANLQGQPNEQVRSNTQAQSNAQPQGAQQN